MDDYKENDVNIDSSSTNILKPKTPLSNKNSFNSVSKYSSPKSSSTNPLLPPIKMENSNKLLERQYADLLIKHNNMVLEFHQLEQDLTIKNQTINDQLIQISNYGKFLSHVKLEFSKTRELMEKELIYYKEMIEDYQLKFLKLNNEVEYYKKLEFNQIESYSNADNDEKYDKLLKDFKILQTNFEIEQNSKIKLIEQIEALAYENNKLKSDLISIHDSTTNVSTEQQDYEFYDHSNDSVIHDLTFNYQTHSSNFEEENIGDQSDDENDFAQLDSLESQDQSSPIKEQFSFETPRENIIQDRVPSLIQTKNFQFPPSPDPNSKIKRQSLPANLQNEFVLSPLKLASQDFDSNTPRQNRYSVSKPNHSRYSSHDIVPIQVEFESKPDQRSTSVPSPARVVEDDEFESDQSKELESTFKKLNGERSSYISSKRSSLVFENTNKFTSDMTKQEIMKLKFELQSLKLHNEKLLSYIGFELQKQKRNIKKLSSRQNLKNIEYSDSKLIEKSKEVLIQKKRVLRSVSINAILSKNYNNKDNIGILQKGIFNFDDNMVNGQNINEDDEIFEEEEEEEQDDDYGFLNFNDKFNSRIFSNGLNNYYEMNSDHDINSNNLKKFKSQNFFVKRDDDSDISDTTLEDSIDDCDWEDKYKTADPNKMNIGLFSQIKYLLTGSHKINKQAEIKESSVDDSLKYQFFSIAIGIIIIGIRFGHYNHNQVS